MRSPPQRRRRRRRRWDSTASRSSIPSQIEATRDAFIPSDEELAYAERAIAAMEEAERNGQGAVTVDGKMVDYANIRMIRRLMSLKGRIDTAPDLRRFSIGDRRWLKS